MEKSDPTGQNTLTTPVAQTERIIILDSLRGIAILGILLMNIPGFGLPRAIFIDLTVLSESGMNFKAWVMTEIVLEGSMRGLFSMLFGAGMILFIRRLQRKSEGLQPAEIYFRRQLWLMLFGLINLYVLLWFFDILFAYAVCGMLLFAFRRVAPKGLFIASFVCVLLFTARENRDMYKDKSDFREGEKIALLDTTVTKLTPAQKEKFGAAMAIKDRFTPANKKLRYENQLRKGQGTFAEVYEQNSAQGEQVHTILLYQYIVWDVLAMMFLGMAFFKTGVLTGEHPVKTYWILFIAGMGIGLLISWLRLSEDIHYKFNWFEKAKGTAFEFYGLSRYFRSVGIFGLIMLLYKSGWFKWLFRLMRPVGQMAFSNYLMQSIICGIIFWGPGFGMFGRLQRYELYYVVLLLWAFQIMFSHVWLRYFLFGPFEWLWRSLTYWKLQPFKKTTIENNIPQGLNVATG